MSNLLDQYKPVSGTQNFTGADAAVTITRPAGATAMLITPEGTGARLRVDGTTTTSTTGASLQTLQPVALMDTQFANASLYLAAGTNACIEYFKRN